MILRVTDPKKGRSVVVGHMDLANKILVLERDSRKHLVKMYDGYAIQEEAWPKIREQEIEKIAVKEIDTKKIYATTVDHWFNTGVVRNLGGHGDQRGLSRKDIVMPNAE